MGPAPAFRFLILLAWFLAATAAGQEHTVRVHLNYFHQFQFAGIYAADWKGFYRDVGLRVDIRELDPTASFPPPLGADDFAVLSTSFPERWARGDDLFLIAIIHQRNPFAVLVHADSPLGSLSDLPSVPRQRLIAPIGMVPESELWSGLFRLGIDPDGLFARGRQPEDFERFIAREIDILPAYVTKEEPELRARGVAVRHLSLGDRHNLFFGDSLVCSGTWEKEHPEIVGAFRTATLRGWDYALAHRGELTDHILSERPSRYQENSRSGLLVEAEGIAEVIDRDTYPIGTITPERLEMLAEHLRSAGVQAAFRPDLVHHDPHPADRWLTWLLGSLLAIAGAFLLLALFTRRQHRRLEESRAHYRTLVEMAEGYFAFRALLVEDGFLPELASPSIATILGHPIEYYQSDPKRFFTQITAVERKGLGAAVRKTLLRGRPLRITLAITHGTSGGTRRLMIHARASRTERGLVADGICLDLTAEAHAENERRRLERQLQQAMRHESLALLAGGVAHDFNNLLGAIRGNAELIKPAIDHDQLMRSRWNRLLMAVDRAAGLVRQILAYTGKAAVESKKLDVGREVRQLIALLKHGLPAGVTINEAIEEGLPPVLFDQVQFQQVVLNLVVNAAESYQGRSGTVTVSVVSRPGGLIILRVSDLGCGMDTATQSRMFEPYFTTKDTGHGLGLAAVRGIVAKAGGKLECRSTLGKGSTFTVTLASLAEAKLDTNDRTPALASPVLSARQVLVVDDDPLIRETVSAILQQIGYHVTEASGGKECLRILESESRFDAMLLDCRMPDMDGPVVLRTLRSKGVSLPVLLMSGYHQDPDLGPLLAQPKTRFIGKPFTGAQLGEALNSLLGHTSSDEESSSHTLVSEYIRQRGWQTEAERR